VVVCWIKVSNKMRQVFDPLPASSSVPTAPTLTTPTGARVTSVTKKKSHQNQNRTPDHVPVMDRTSIDKYCMLCDPGIPSTQHTFLGATLFFVLVSPLSYAELMDFTDA
jgi:hypothetical protein